MKTKPLTFLLAAACALALTGCDKGTLPGAAPKQSPAAVAAGDPVTDFEQCRQFFPGVLPRVPNLQKRQPRDLCYDAFAILHSGQSKTPVFVVERKRGTCTLLAQATEVIYRRRDAAAGTAPASPGRLRFLPWRCAG